MTYKLLALDIDGTILDSNLHLSNEVREAIAAAQAQGVIVTLATGRMYKSAVPFAAKLNMHDALICYQGSLVRHPITDEVYYSVNVPGDLAGEAVTIMREAGLFVVAYIDERLCVAEHTKELDQYMHYHAGGYDDVTFIPELAAHVAAHPPTKLLFIAEPDVVGREVAHLAEHFGTRLSAIRSHALFGELCAPNVSKGTALKALADRLGIPREQVIAIGDHENDLAMIQWAGLGLAMGNGIPEVRAVADAIIPSVNENGVAWAIEHYILNPTHER